MQVRCPQCHTPVEIDSDGKLSDIACPACGSSFSLLGTAETVPYEAGRKTIGHFQLVEQIGVGTFGFVWKARDTELDRTVALKIPRKGQLDPEETEQFLREARAAAQLRHPNIVSVHEVGRERDTVFIVSDFVEGVTLADRLTAQKFSCREAAELCAKIADALHHAHEAGVIHRDLKPGNIILDARGEPHIMDFGLARREAGEVTMTVEGRVLGTPAYMSPEQAKGAAHTADRRSDVYSLGVILFELLTGERPFRGNVRMLVHQVINDEPPSPRRLNGSVPRDLETICLKCLEKEAGRRYPTANKLGEDVRRFLSGEPIEARPISRIERGWRWCKRKPSVAALAILLMLSLLSGTIVASVLALLAQAANDKLRESAGELKRQNYFHAINLAYHAWNSGNRNRMEQLLDSIRPEADSQGLGGFEWRYLEARQQELRAVPEIPTPDTVITVSYSPDGKNLAIGCIDGTVLVHDLAKGISISLPEQLKGSYVAFSPQGSYLAAGSGTRELRVWTFPQFEPIRQSGWEKTPIYAVAFSGDESQLAFGRTDGVVEIRSLPAGELVWTPVEPRPTELNGMRLAFDRDGRYLAGGWNDVVVLWDLKTRNVVRLLEYSTVGAGFPVLKFSADGKSLLAGGEFGVESWEVAQEGLRGPPQQNPRLAATCASFSPDGALLAIGCADFKVWIVKPARFEAIGRLLQKDFVNTVAFSPDGKSVAAGSRENLVRVWNVDRWRTDGGRSIAPRYSPPLAVSFDGRLATLREEKETRRRIVDIWNPGTGKSTTLPDQGGPEVGAVAFAPDRPVLAVATEDGVIRLWNTDNLAAIRDWQAHSGPGSAEFYVSGQRINCLAFSADGKTLASGGASSGLATWDLSGTESGEHPPTKESILDEGWVSCVAFSPDGLLAAAGMTRHRRGWTEIYRLRGGKWESVIKLSHPEWVRRVAFSPDGKLMALQHDFSAGIIRVYEVPTWKRLREYQGHSSKSVSLTFTPDGRRLVTGGDDGTIRFWDIGSNEPVGALETGERIRQLAFLPDGTTLVSASWDGWVRLWSASPK